MDTFLKKVMYYLGLLLIALFLFVTHAKQLNTMGNYKDVALFNFATLDFRQVILYISALMFAITTTNIIGLLKTDDRAFWPFIIIIAISEWVVVQLFNNTEILEKWWIILSANYYATYTAIIIIMYAYIKKKRNEHKVAEAIASNQENEIVSSDAFESYKESIEQPTPEFEKGGVEIIEDLDNKYFNVTYDMIIDHKNNGLNNKQIAEIFKKHPSTIGRIIKNGESKKNDIDTN